MECRECCHILPLYLDHALTARDLENVRRHLQECKHCSQEFAKLSETVELVCHLECVEPPVDFHERLMCRLQEECRLQETRWPWWKMASWGTLAAAAATVLVVLILPQQKMTFQQPPPLADADVQAPGRSVVQKDALALAANMPTPALGLENMQEPLAAQSLLSNPWRMPVRQKTLSQGLLKSVGYGTLAETQPRFALVDEPGLVVPVESKRRMTNPIDEWSGEKSNVRTPATRVLASPQEWLNFMGETGIQPLAIPQIQWEQQRVAAIFIGEQPAPGYTIQILQIQAQEEKVVVAYRVTEPRTPATSATASCPYILFVIPRFPEPVEFSRK